MVRQYKSKVSLNTLNSQRNYSFGFDYLNSTFIHVNLNGVELTQPRDFTVNEHEIILVNPPTTGGSLLIYRVTPSNRIVSWTDNSILKADNLNLSYIQLMHLAEEQMDNVRDETITRALDEAWDVKGSRIKRLGTPTDDMDAVPYGYVRHQKEEVEQLTAEVRQHKNTIEQAQRDVLSRQSTVVETAQRATELIQRVTEQLNTNNTEFTNKVTKAKADIAGLSQEANTAIADKLSKATTDITQLGERTTTDVTSRINSAKSDLTQQLTNATNTINSKVSTVNREIDTRINNTSSDINERITSAKQELTAQANTLKQELTSNANTATSTLNATIRTANEVKAQIESAAAKLKGGVLDEKTKSDIANSLLSKQEALINNRIAENNLAQASVHEAVITRKINENNTSQARANESLITSKISANNSTLKSEISSDITSKINANNTTLKSAISSDIISKINANNTTLKSDINSIINSTIVTKVSEHNTDTTAHNLNKYMSMKPIPTGITDWNNLTDTGMYEATASMWGWRNAPSSTRVYYYGVVQVIKSDTNKITQVFYSYGANNKPCNICYRTFYNAWGAWHYHGDYDVTVTDITKHNEGLTITKGDTSSLLKLFTTNKADTNTNLVPTLAVVKELLGNANLDITELLKGNGVRYDFTNESAWYLCLGQAFGNLIIQGGKFKTNASIFAYALQFNKVLCVSPLLSDEPKGFMHTTVRPKAITNTSFKIAFISNNNYSEKANNDGYWVAFGV